MLFSDIHTQTEHLTDTSKVPFILERDFTKVNHFRAVPQVITPAPSSSPQILKRKRSLGQIKPKEPISGEKIAENMLQYFTEKYKKGLSRIKKLKGKKYNQNMEEWSQIEEKLKKLANVKQKGGRGRNIKGVSFLGNIDQSMIDKKNKEAQMLKNKGRVINFQ